MKKKIYQEPTTITEVKIQMVHSDGLHTSVTLKPSEITVKNICAERISGHGWLCLEPSGIKSITVVGTPIASEVQGIKSLAKKKKAKKK